VLEDGDAGRGVVLVAGCGAAFGVAGAAARVGVVLAADGFGAVAASTAVTSVFAAARAPTPSARPKRTESMD